MEGMGEMKIKKQGNKLVIEHLLRRNETYRISESKSFKTISIFKKPIIVTGVSNATEDGKYVIFLDYDNVSKDIVLEDIDNLIKPNNLPPFYLFATKQEKNIGNYHAICLFKTDYEGVQSILSKTRCDPKYKSMDTRNPYRSWVLRISNKGQRGNPRFLEIVGLNMGKYNYHAEISEAHLKLLKKIYKLPEIAYEKLDGSRKVKIHTYETSL